MADLHPYPFAYSLQLRFISIPLVFRGSTFSQCDKSGRRLELDSPPISYGVGGLFDDSYGNRSSRGAKLSNCVLSKKPVQDRRIPLGRRCAVSYGALLLQLRREWQHIRVASVSFFAIVDAFFGFPVADMPCAGGVLPSVDGGRLQVTPQFASRSPIRQLFGVLVEIKSGTSQSRENHSQPGQADSPAL